MRTRFYAHLLPLLLLTGIAFAQGGKEEDIPLPPDPPVPTLAPAASKGADDIPLPDDPAVPKGEAPAPGQEPGNIADAATGSFLSQDFMRTALTGGILAAVVCSYLGLFVVARRMIFVGVALAQMSSAGIAVTFLLAGFGIAIKPLYGSLLFMFLGVVLFSRRWAPRRVSNDCVIGVFYLAAMAVGILMIAKAASGDSHALSELQGDVLTVNWAEVMEMAVAFAIIGALHIAFAKEFMLVSMDRDTAGTQGLAAARWDFLLFLTIGVAVAISIRSAGVLMTSSLLILPAATALLMVSRWWKAAILSPALGVIAVVIGLYLSFEKDVPASAAIAGVSVAMLLPALVWRTVRQT